MYTHVHVHVCTHVHVYMCVHMHVHATSVKNVHTCMYTCVQMCAFICTCVCTYRYVYIYISVPIFSCRESTLKFSSPEVGSLMVARYQIFYWRRFVAMYYTCSLNDTLLLCILACVHAYMHSHTTHSQLMNA